MISVIGILIISIILARNAYRLLKIKDRGDADSDASAVDINNGMPRNRGCDSSEFEQNDSNINSAGNSEKISEILTITSLPDSNDNNDMPHSSSIFYDNRASMQEYVEKKLQYFRFKRAYGGHANDGDSIVMTIGITPKIHFSKFLASIGAEYLDSDCVGESIFNTMNPVELLKRIQLYGAVSASTIDGIWVGLTIDSKHLISMEMACGYEVNSDILIIASKIEEYAKIYEPIICDPPIYPVTVIGSHVYEPNDMNLLTRANIEKSDCNINLLGFNHVDSFSLIRCSRNHINDYFEVSSAGEIRATLLEITDIWGLYECSFEYHSVCAIMSIGDYANIVDFHLKKLNLKEIANFTIESQTWTCDYEYILSLSNGEARKNAVISSKDMSDSLAKHLIALMDFQFSPRTRIDVSCYPEIKDVMLKLDLK